MENIHKTEVLGSDKLLNWIYFITVIMCFNLFISHNINKRAWKTPPYKKSSVTLEYYFYLSICKIYSLI